MNWPPFTGPTMCTLADGSLAFSDSEEWRHECEAKFILNMPYETRVLHIESIRDMRGIEAVDALIATMNKLRDAARAV